jgi:hypothetical protein
VNFPDIAAAILATDDRDDCVEESSATRRRSSMNGAVQQSAPLSRMTLDAIIKGRIKRPRRIVLYGPDGIGKSTFGANAPKPIFLGTEEGTETMDVSRLPAATTWAEVLDGVRLLTVEKHDFESLIVDTLTEAEPLIWREICRRANAASIEDVGGGYGKGYTAALDEWRVFARALERLQAEKGMHVILNGHSLIKAFKNPQGDDFDRYILSLNEKAAGLLRQWAMGVYFANYETFAVADKAKRVRGVSTGVRLLYTQRTAAFDAKDRYGLPLQLPLSWTEFEKAARLGQPMAPDEFVDAIKHRAVQLGSELEKQALGALERVGSSDAQKLAELHNWCIAKLAIAAQSNPNPNTQSKES